MATKVIMPQLGESVVEGTVTKWLHKEGEKINEFDALLEVNTDKVDTEIPSPAGGTLLKLLVPEGTTVQAGTVLAWIGEPGEAIPGDGDGKPAAEQSEASRDVGETAEPAKASQEASRETAEGKPTPAATEEKPASTPTAEKSPSTEPAPAAEGSGSAPESGAPPAPKTVPVAMNKPPVPPGKTAEPTQKPMQGFISPVVARLARERNIDLSRVRGTGSGGRITKQDVVAYVEQMESTPPPEVAAWETPGEGDLFRPTELMFPAEQSGASRSDQPRDLQRGAEGTGEAGTAAQASAPATRPEAERGEGARTADAVTPTSAPTQDRPSGPTVVQPPAGEVVPLTTIRKSIAEHMVLSSRTSPHVTTVMEADMSAVSAHRQANKDAFTRDGANLTFSAYFVAAAVAALKANPMVNASWSEEGIRLHRQINIGMAASLGEEGLIVPVIKNADGLSLLGIARAVNDLAERARSRRLQPDEVKGGTFTITNHGTGGSLFATPIINQPQSAILGAGLIQKRVVVINDAIAIRPMVYLSLSFDHRILDGASADGFLAKVVETLEKWV